MSQKDNTIFSEGYFFLDKLISNNNKLTIISLISWNVHFIFKYITRSSIHGCMSTEGRNDGHQHFSGTSTLNISNTEM